MSKIISLYNAGLVNNISIVTGQASNVVVVDIDVPALSWWTELLRVNPPIPETFIVKTPSGGYHYYFRYIPGLNNMNQILGQSIDFRTDGGQAIFPGSTGYAVAAGYQDGRPIIAEMPSWLLQLLQYNQNIYRA